MKIIAKDKIVFYFHPKQGQLMKNPTILLPPHKMIFNILQGFTDIQCIT